MRNEVKSKLFLGTMNSYISVQRMWKKVRYCEQITIDLNQLAELKKWKTTLLQADEVSQSKNCIVQLIENIAYLRVGYFIAVRIL